MTDGDLVLVRLETARTALAEAKTIQETKNVLDAAVATETFFKRQNMSDELVLQATSIKMEALRQLGNMLKETPRNTGPRLIGGSEKYSGGSKVEPPDEIPTLAELGLDKKISKLAQDVANLPDDQFEKVKAGVSSIQKEIQKQSVMAIHNEKRSRPLPTGKYSVIYADPPWSYDNSGFNQSAASHYPTMTVDAICDLPIRGMAEETTVLFLWATSPLLPEAFRVITEWGFEYKASMIWVKNHAPGIGWWVQTQHEILLIASNGSNHPATKPSSVVVADNDQHSKKPVEFYEIIEKMYPGSKIELFARNSRPGWESWGNENV